MGATQSTPDRSRPNHWTWSKGHLNGLWSLLQQQYPPLVDIEITQMVLVIWEVTWSHQGGSNCLYNETALSSDVSSALWFAYVTIKPMGAPMRQAVPLPTMLITVKILNMWITILLRHVVSYCNCAAYIRHFSNFFLSCFIKTIIWNQNVNNTYTRKHMFWTDNCYMTYIVWQSLLDRQVTW